jgi:hypothetical protein
VEHQNPHVVNFLINFRINNNKFNANNYPRRDRHQMSAPSFQSKAIFDHADTFFHAIDQLQRSPSPIIGAVAMPVMVVSAFASELYFKTLIVLDGNQAPRSHDLYDLFSKLSLKAKAQLESRWNPIIRDREEFLKNIEHHTASIPRILEDALKEGREGFERLRYIYEGGDPFGFSLGDLPLAIRRTILDLQPSWSPQDTLSKPEKLRLLLSKVHNLIGI